MGLSHVGIVVRATMVAALVAAFTSGSAVAADGPPGPPGPAAPPTTRPGVAAAPHPRPDPSRDQFRTLVSADLDAPAAREHLLAALRGVRVFTVSFDRKVDEITRENLEAASDLARPLNDHGGWAHVSSGTGLDNGRIIGITLTFSTRAPEPTTPEQWVDEVRRVKAAGYRVWSSGVVFEPDAKARERLAAAWSQVMNDVTANLAKLKAEHPQLSGFDPAARSGGGEARELRYRYGVDERWGFGKGGRVPTRTDDWCDIVLRLGESNGAPRAAVPRGASFPRLGVQVEWDVHAAPAARPFVDKVNDLIARRVEPLVRLEHDLQGPTDAPKPDR